jgi:putative tricarboxylic transport membrane protein
MILSDIDLGLQAMFTITNLAWCLAGVTVGTLVGVLPGLGAMVAMSMFLPLTYHMDIIPALITMAGIYYGSQYGGSISATLLRMPGHASSAVTCLDGYPMTQQGRGGVALVTAAISSFVGGMVAVIFMIILGSSMPKIMFMFGPAEYFSIMLLGLVAASVLERTNVLANISMVILGILLALVGTDVHTGQPRFTFGIEHLSHGIHIIVIAMGVFGLSELLARISDTNIVARAASTGRWMPNTEETKRSIGSTVRGSFIGSLFGILPGTGPTIASFASYMWEKMISKHPEQFGKGAIEGVAGPESANNAASQTAFIPTLTLGVPGDPMMILIMALLLIQGVSPGPTLMIDHPELFWALVVCFVIGNIMLLILNLPLIKIWTSLLKIPYVVLYPMIIFVMCTGVYAVNNNAFDVVMLAFFGVFGLVLRRAGFSVAPLILGFVLGAPMEENLRRALLLAQYSPEVLLARPIVSITLIIVVLLITARVIMQRKKNHEYLL